MTRAPVIRDPFVAVGVDPGTRTTGYGVVGLRRGAFVRVDHGVFRPPPDAEVGTRLLFLFERLRALLAHHAPDVLALEQVFFHKNAQSTLRIGEARAVVLLAAAERGIPVMQYSTKTAKRAVAGSGAADKAFVQEMVTRELKLSAPPEPHDAADALALAICVLRDPALDPRFH